MRKSVNKTDIFFIFLLIILAIIFLAPILFVVINSFKGKFYISDNFFALPSETTFSGIENYINGIRNTNFLSAFGWSLFITIGSVIVILLFTSMTAYYITRIKNRLTSFLYYVFVFSMAVPFQMVMYTMSKFASGLHLNSPWGLIVLYLGFGAGLSVFMFCGFIKSVPIEIEEAAMIDGCNPMQNFFLVVFPILKPTAVTVSILNAMWIWNDYLLPYLMIGLNSRYKTIPVAVQYLVGSYGSKDMGAMMAILVLSVLPIVIFYLVCQKYIIEGVVAGAVKG